MADGFEWKSDGKIFKGVGIYHLTFVVTDRRPLLGEVVAEYPDEGFSTVERSADKNAMADDRAKMASVKLTHDGTRWRMIAGNVMLEMIGENRAKLGK